MSIMIALMAILAVEVSLPAGQAGGQESPKEVMEKALTKNISDSQVLLEQYQFDVIKNQEVSDEERISDRLSIDELFGRGRYRYEMDDKAIIILDGRAVYLIDFYPDKDPPGAPEGTNRRGKVKNEILNHLRGTVYVDREDFGIVRVVTHVNSPPEKISIVGRLYVMDATLEQGRLGKIWVPKEISVKAEFSYFFGWRHSRENTTIEFTNFRLKAP